jgi:hypothetical protein
MSKESRIIMEAKLSLNPTQKKQLDMNMRESEMVEHAFTKDMIFKNFMDSNDDIEVTSTRGGFSYKKHLQDEKNSDTDGDKEEDKEENKEEDKKEDKECYIQDRRKNIGKASSYLSSSSHDLGSLSHKLGRNYKKFPIKTSKTPRSLVHNGNENLDRYS